MAEKKEDVNSLLKHLGNYQNKLSTGTVPERHKGKEVAYKAYLELEIKRTKAKIESKTGVALK